MPNAGGGEQPDDERDEPPGVIQLNPRCLTFGEA